jgi:hypothetical protein
MLQVKVLVIGKNVDIVQLLVKLTGKFKNLLVSGTTDEADILQIKQENAPDILIISSGLTDQSEKAIDKQFRLLHPNIKIIYHYGGGSGLLKSEIQSVVDFEI